MKSLLWVLAFALSSGGAWAAEGSKSTGTLVDLSAEASRSVANDLARASVHAEASDGLQASVARKVNESISQALALAKTYPSVKVQTGSTHSWANSDKNGKIIGWRMRSELQLESRDMGALSELLGKLQTGMGVSQITLHPAPETRRRMEDAAMLDAVSAFQNRARLVGEHLKKPWRIRQMAVNTAGGRLPMMPMLARAAPMADASPMPIEAGDSQITVTVTGQIELLD